MDTVEIIEGIRIHEYYEGVVIRLMPVSGRDQVNQTKTNEGVRCVPTLYCSSRALPVGVISSPLAVDVERVTLGEECIWLVWLRHFLGFICLVVACGPTGMRDCEVGLC